MNWLEAARQVLITNAEITAIVPATRIKYAGSQSEKPPYIRLDMIDSVPNKAYDFQIGNRDVSIQISVFTDTPMQCNRLIELIEASSYSRFTYMNTLIEMYPQRSLVSFEDDTRLWIGIVNCVLVTK